MSAGTSDEAVKAIAMRFLLNTKRVQNLLSLYDELATRNERNYQHDILRSAVVLLHATLEDVLRGLLKWKKLQSDPKQLSDILFYSDDDDRGDKSITLSSLASRVDMAGNGLTVRELIDETIRVYYDRRSFNDRNQVSKALTSLGLKPTDHAKTLNTIDPMIQRRHLIVHQSDRIEPVAGKHGKLTNIVKDDVKNWLSAVSQFLTAVIVAIQSRVEPPLKGKPGHDAETAAAVVEDEDQQRNRHNK